MPAPIARDCAADSLSATARWKPQRGATPIPPARRLGPGALPWGPFARAFASPERRSGYLPGIDGLRAIAVLAVLLFHGGVATFGGGFLGVEVFFVVSGYLITLLLLREHAETGAIALRAFWLRRARRLLPAAFAVTSAVLAYALVALPDEVSGLRQDALSAFAYVTNWWLVFGNQPYFEAMGRPSLLQHLWSLAVEEQFYLVWPVALAVLLRVAGKHGAFVATVALGIASYALMGVLHNPEADPARVYYGTDTRAGGLLLGAALAYAWDPRRVNPKGLARSALLAAGPFAFAALALVFLAVGSSTKWLYPWGFVLASIATVAAIVSATLPGPNPLGRALSLAPMRWGGTRSYGLYLWHWPIFQVTRSGLDVPLDGLDLLLLRLALTAVAAELSYCLIEQPFRTGAAVRAFRGLFARRPVRARVLTASGGFAAFALAFSAFTAHPATTPEYLQGGGFHGVVGGIPEPVPTATPTEAPTATPTVEPTATTSANPAGDPATETPPTPAPPPPTSPPQRPAPTPPPPPPPSNADILAIGDSVLMGAAPYMGIAGRVEVDALVGRQSGEVLSLVRQRAAAGTLPPIVVVHTGNNGPLTLNTADAIVEAAGGAKVVFVTVRVGRSWEDTTNETVRAMPARYSNAVVADWYEASAGREECFASDGIHLSRAGGELFATVIASALG